MSAPTETIEAIDPEELREAARRLLDDKVDRRAAWDKSGDAGRGELTASMAELGWLLLTAPAERGGLGQSFAALAPIYEEQGRALAPVTISGTMAAVDILAAAPEGSAGHALLDRIIAGDAQVGIAFAAQDQLGSPLNATLRSIPDLAVATDLILFAADGTGEGLLVSLSDPTVHVEQVEAWDRSRPLADVTLNNTQAERLGLADGEAGKVARAHLDLAIALDSIGGAVQALDEAVEYMGTRQQFNRPIGSFQALKHRAADLRTGNEVARALTYEASAAFVDRRGGWADLAGQAKYLAADAYRQVTEESVQFHGGIGFTWEHDCHLFLKRALLNEMLGGTPSDYRDRVAEGIFTRALG